MTTFWTPTSQQRASVVICELSPEVGRTDDSAATTRQLFPQGDVVDRLLGYGRQYRAQHEARQLAAARDKALEEAAERRRLAAARLAHAKAYHQQHSAEELAAHRAARDARQAENRAAWEASIAQQAPHRPSLTDRSVRLAARRREKEGLAELSPSEVQRRRHEAAERARQEAAEAYARSHTPRGTPTITARAQALRHAVPASERLYRHARELQHADSLAGIERQLREVTNIMQASKPRVSAKAAALPPRPTPVHEQLYTQAVDQAQQRRKLVKAYDDAQGSFRPTLDPTSELLTRHLPHTTADRLYGTGTDTALHARWPSDPRLENMTFAPQINTPPRRRSCSHREGSAAGSAVADRALAWQARRDARLRAQAAERRAEEARQCTFHPTVTARAARRGGSLSGAPPRFSDTAYADPFMLDEAQSSMSSSRARLTSPAPWQPSEAWSRGVESRWCDGDENSVDNVRGDSWPQPTPRMRSTWRDEEGIRSARQPSPGPSPDWEGRDELMRIAYEALAEADMASLDFPLDDG